MIIRIQLLLSLLWVASAIMVLTCSCTGNMESLGTDGDSDIILFCSCESDEGCPAGYHCKFYPGHPGCGEACIMDEETDGDLDSSDDIDAEQSEEVGSESDNIDDAFESDDQTEQETGIVCSPPCTDITETCSAVGCICSDGYHDGGDGVCVSVDTCSNGFGIPAGGVDCIPLELACPDEDVCRHLTGWSEGSCQYSFEPENQSCDGTDPNSCVTVFGCQTGTCTPIVGDCPELRPILFMHGVNGSSANFNTMIERFVADGWPRDYLVALDAADPSWGCSVDNASMIRQAAANLMANTGAGRIDLVAHSMGTLSSRYFMKFLGGQNVVNTYVTMGGMHHGLSSPCWAPDFLDVCIWQELCESGDYIAALNSDPATPGCTHWVSIYGTADETVPNESSFLEGAENISVEGITHDTGENGLLENATVYAEVKRVLQYECW